MKRKKQKYILSGEGGDDITQNLQWSLQFFIHNVSLSVGDHLTKTNR